MFIAIATYLTMFSPLNFSPRHIKRYLAQLAQAKSVCERRIAELDGSSAAGESVSRYDYRGLRFKDVA